MAENIDQDVEDDITEEKRLILLQYQEITASDDNNTSIAHLKKHNWNLEAAVQDTFNVSDGVSPSFQHIQQPVNHITPSSLSSYSVGQNVVQVHRQNTWLSWLVGISYLPVTIVTVGISFVYSATSDLLFYVASLIWPSLGRAPSEPIEDVMQFKREYEETYGIVHPTFYLGSYAQVLSDAKKELKFLLVYLHSKDRKNTDKFCREVLGHPGLTEYINGSMLFWACDVNTNEGYKICRATRANTFPFLAIVSLIDNRMTIVWRMKDTLDVDELIANCARVIDENESFLIAVRAERQERSMNQVIRNEQDVAYLASLAEDKKKEMERKKLVEQEKLQEQQRVDKENEKLRKIQELENKRRSAREYFESVSEPSSTDVDAIQIRFKLPNGQLLQRYFLKTDPLKVLYALVISNENSPAEFLLSTSFPKKTFPLSDVTAEKTLEEVGIATNTAMFIQNLVEDSSDDDE